MSTAIRAIFTVVFTDTSLKIGRAAGGVSSGPNPPKSPNPGFTPGKISTVSTWVFSLFGLFGSYEGVAMSATATLEFIGKLLPSDRKYKLPPSFNVHCGCLVAIGRDPKQNAVLLKPPVGRYPCLQG